MTDYPTRDELDNQYTWDLTRIYETPADWEAAADELATQADALGDHENPTDAPAELAAALEAIETALVAKSRITLYAQLRRNEHTNDDIRRDHHRRAQRLSATVDEAVRTLRRRIQRDAGAVREYGSVDADRSELEGWHDYLADLLAQAPRTRDAGTESVIAAFEPVVETQTDTVVAITTGDVEAPTVEGPDGDPISIDRGSYRSHLESSDRAFRRRAHEAFVDALAEHEHALAAAVGEKAQAHAALAEARTYDSVREMALSRPSYPDTGMHVSFAESAHDALVENVREQLDAYHDLLESRRSRLGVETLRPWDERVPVVPEDAEAPTISFSAVREHVLAAVEPLGEDYRDRLETFFDERRLDVYPTKRKRTDIPAYCPSSPETGAFVLANFREDVRTAFYLAHELGHAMHVEFMRAAQPPRYVNSPRPISEVPSLVHELLLADHLLANGPAELAPFVRERRAQFLAGNVYEAGQSAAFLHDVYQAVESGDDLTPTRLAEIYADYADEFSEPISPGDDETVGAGWRQRAYARQPYHNYQYVTGTVAAVSVFQRLRSGEPPTESYLEFLRNTGRRGSESSFESLGVDVTASEPYERVAAELDRIRAARVD